MEINNVSVKDNNNSNLTISTAKDNRDKTEKILI